MKGQQGLDYPGVSVIAFCYIGFEHVMIKRGKNCRDEHGRWDLAAGALKPHENVLDGLRREIKEEINADCVLFEFLGYRDVHREFQGKPDHWVGLDFKVLIDPAGVKIGEPYKFDDIGWFTLDSLPTPLHSQVALFLDKYKEKLQKR